MPRPLRSDGEPACGVKPLNGPSEVSGEGREVEDARLQAVRQGDSETCVLFSLIQTLSLLSRKDLEVQKNAERIKMDIEKNWQMFASKYPHNSPEKKLWEVHGQNMVSNGIPVPQLINIVKELQDDGLLFQAKTGDSWRIDFDLFETFEDCADIIQHCRAEDLKNEGGELPSWCFEHSDDPVVDSITAGLIVIAEWKLDDKIHKHAMLVTAVYPDYVECFNSDGSRNACPVPAKDPCAPPGPNWGFSTCYMIQVGDVTCVEGCVQNGPGLAQEMPKAPGLHKAALEVISMGWKGCELGGSPISHFPGHDYLIQRGLISRPPRPTLSQWYAGPRLPYWLPQPPPWQSGLPSMFTRAPTAGARAAYAAGSWAVTGGCVVGELAGAKLGGTVAGACGGSKTAKETSEKAGGCAGSVGGGACAGLVVAGPPGAAAGSAVGLASFLISQAITEGYNIYRDDRHKFSGSYGLVRAHPCDGGCTGNTKDRGCPKCGLKLCLTCWDVHKKTSECWNAKKEIAACS